MNKTTLTRKNECRQALIPLLPDGSKVGIDIVSETSRRIIVKVFVVSPYTRNILNVSAYVADLLDLPHSGDRLELKKMVSPHKFGVIERGLQRELAHAGISCEQIY